MIEGSACIGHNIGLRYLEIARPDSNNDWLRPTNRLHTVIVAVSELFNSSCYFA
jgi:hypothetical protein